jgi:hypothetical protein
MALQDFPESALHLVRRGSLRAEPPIALEVECDALE